MSSGKSIIAMTVTNDLSQDQRMKRIASTLSSDYDVILIGRLGRDSLPYISSKYKSDRISCRFQRGFLFYLEYNFRLLIYLIQLRPDIVSSVDLDTLLAGRMASWWLGAKLIFDAHEDFVAVPELVNRPVRHAIWDSVAKLCLSASTDCYTVNQSIATILKRRYAQNFQIIKNTPTFKESSRGSNDIDPSDVKLLYQGMLNQGRGLDLIIKALVSRPYWQLTVIGVGDLYDDLVQLSVNLGCADRVHFIGFVEPEQLHTQTIQHDIGLNLLDPASGSYYHSSANKAYDYIMAGLPSINMAFPEYIALNQELPTSILIERYDHSAVLAAIDQLVSDQQLYHQLRQNCLDQRRKLNWSSERDRLLAIYQDASIQVESPC